MRRTLSMVLAFTIVLIAICTAYADSSIESKWSWFTAAPTTAPTAKVVVPVPTKEATPLPTQIPKTNYTTLRRGDRGDVVVKLQKRLIELGYLSGSADGIYGKMTESAVIKAQKAFGTGASGTATPEFQAVLYSSKAVKAPQSSNTGSSSSSSSGMSSSDKNLSNYDYRKVSSKGRGSLVFQYAPWGKSMKGHKFYDGDWIFVNVKYKKNGYSIAYENGDYGYVDASYIDWDSRKKGGNSTGSGSNSNTDDGIPSAAKDFSDYAWRTVASKGRGSLVFQKSPGGKSIKGHKFYDGDSIYVNIYYRKNGYAVAFEDGEYGYVDASYIAW